MPSSRSSIKHNGAYAAPLAFREATPLFTTYSPDYDVNLAAMRVADIGEVVPPLLDPAEGSAWIQESLLGLFSAAPGFFPVIIGGDHAITAPAVRAFSAAHPGQRIGLVHFDAHNDVRVMDHGPTNGTPIRQILESDAGVSGSNLVQVGIHGFMNSSYYKQWVEQQGATIITGRECRREGIDRVIRRVIDIAGRDVDRIYVTVDIDVLELAYAPGTASASFEGLHPADLGEALFALGQEPLVGAIDFVEHDPFRDVATITGRSLVTCCLTFLAGLFLRLNDGWRGYPARETVRP